MNAREFFYCAVKGNSDVMQRGLAENPALATSAVNIGFTALHGAADAGQLQVARVLIQSGADPNVRNREGVAPLHLAATPEVAEYLIQSGAEVNLQSDAGFTPLHMIAATPDRVAVMQLLIEQGANRELKTLGGVTALDLVRRRQDTEKIALLSGDAV